MSSRHSLSGPIVPRSRIVISEKVDIALPSLAGAPWLAEPRTQAVFAALAAAGHPARAVGGVVRNALMGLPVTDIDIATPATPAEVQRAAAAAGLASVATGAKHGTITVVSSHMPHEVTTLRRDVSTDGRRATVAFTADWAEDAARRDFTMNALYCDADGQVYDPLGGYLDVVARCVRFIGNADQRIAEDYLRILRFYRFHATLGEGPLDPHGLVATVRGRVGLAQLSAERVRVEILKLLAGPRALDALDAMSGHGLTPLVLGVAPRPGVLGATIEAEERHGIKPDPIARLSALTLAAPEDIPRLADRLRLSGAERAALVAVEPHVLAAFRGLDAASARRRLYELGTESWRRQVLAATAIWPEDTGLHELYSLPDRWPVPKLPVKGADVLALGLTPGPEIGRILGEVERWWIEADFPNEVALRGRLAQIVAQRQLQ